MRSYVCTVLKFNFRTVQTCIVYRLPPYFENFGKRTLKAPKLYFIDTGLASYLLGIETEAQLQRDSIRGHLFENLMILEMIKYRYHQGLDPNLYYYRDNHQHEVDVILKEGQDLIPIEIKSSQTFHMHFLQGLDYFAGLAQGRCPRGYVIYAGMQDQEIHFWRIMNYQKILSVFQKTTQASVQ